MKASTSSWRYWQAAPAEEKEAATVHRTCVYARFLQGASPWWRVVEHGWMELAHTTSYSH
eukprot:856172-Pelagomonas_calceolata.AAC.9